MAYGEDEGEEEKKEEEGVDGVDGDDKDNDGFGNLNTGFGFACTRLSRHTDRQENRQIRRRA